MRDRTVSIQRRYGFACSQCRQKKIKCDGTKPSCRTCIKVHSLCTYKNNEGSTAHLRGELSRCRNQLISLEEKIRALTLASGEEKELLLQQLIGEVGSRADDAKIDKDIEHEENMSDSVDDENEDREQQNHQRITVDEHGNYFGATSRFHTGHDTPPEQSQTLDADRVFHTRWLASNARFQKSWEQTAFSSLDRDAQIGSITASTLLRIYWTWQAPLHNCVYRHCFFRDMATGGPYFNKFLLNVIYAHASRHVPEIDPIYSQVGQGEIFLQRAKGLLIDELGSETPSIPTIQGLLILGGRQCAIGKSSEGWLYTGMAIRMIKDLGLHLHNSNLGLKHNLEPDDLEARKRLYLSAYSWDKSISLCLGRSPSLVEMPYSPKSLLDKAGDFDLWTPFYLGEETVTYPPTACLTTLTFMHFCELSTLINHCYDTVYSGKIEGIKIQPILELERSLEKFHRQLPEALRIEDADMFDSCPPPHIFCLNILLHTLMILIYRPFFSKRATRALNTRARQVCLHRAEVVNSLIRLYGKTFNFRNQSYLVSYCVYTAATVELQELQTSSKHRAEAAAARLATTMNMLESEAKQTPGIRRSIDIIKSRLQTWQALASPADIDTCQNSADNLSPGRLSGPHVHTSCQDISPSNTGQISAATEQLSDIELDLCDGYAFSGQFSMPPVLPRSQGEMALAVETQLPLGWYAYDASGGFVSETADWTWHNAMLLAGP